MAAARRCERWPVDDRRHRHEAADMTDTIDITEHSFVRRFANLLAATRQHDDRSLDELARSSGGRFTPDELARLEAGRTPIDDAVAAEVARLYGADLGLIVPAHPPLQLDGNVMSAGEASTLFNPVDATSLLASYLVVLRQLRRAQPDHPVAIRHDDVEVLARHTGLPGWVVVERLCDLMELDPRHRRSMVDLFASGAPVVALHSGRR
jgi:hypothetical protein